MRCFYHQDKEAVATCKACAKGLCLECAVDLGKGLACRGHCEENAKDLIELVDRNIRLSKEKTQVNFVVPAVSQSTSQPTDYVAAQLTTHIRETQGMHRLYGVFGLAIGMVVLIEGVGRQDALLKIVGVCCVVFACICFFRTRRISLRPKLPETRTR